MTYSYGDGRQLSDKEFDEYFEEVYAHENNSGDRDDSSEIDTVDESTFDVEDSTKE